MATKKNSGVKKGSRVKPTVVKAGVTKNRGRRYDCGGKLKSK